MTIVRVGLSETRKFGEGWDAVFRGKAKGQKAAKSVAGKKRSKPARKKKK